MTRAWAIGLLLATGYPGVVLAQSPPARTPPRPTTTAVPKEQLPPKGMCRIWVNGVPAARQPAPTDCATAVRNRPPNARVLFPAERPAVRRSLRPNEPPAKGQRPATRDTTARRKPPTKPPA
jgi:hypothetical protein